MAYDLKTEKVIARPASDVFNAIKAGRLFMNCSGDSNSMKIDFRVGGKYHIDFKNHGVANFGEFIEIVPNRKIVFTWCQTFGADQKPDTQVSIELFDDGPKTKLVLHHTGFNTEATRDGHKGGWIDGLADMASEIGIQERSLGHLDLEDESLVLVLCFAVALGHALAFLPGETTVRGQQ